MTPAEYRAKAMMHLELAQGEADNRIENMRLALSYLRLADMAEKNAATDIVYETPSVSLPMQQQQQQPPQPQQQQQQQQREVKPDEPDA
jgi:hypothetical protein